MQRTIVCYKNRISIFPSIYNEKINVYISEPKAQR